MDKGDWQATAHEVAKSRIRLSDKHFHFQDVQKKAEFYQSTAEGKTWIKK